MTRRTTNTAGGTSRTAAGAARGPNSTGFAASGPLSGAAAVVPPSVTARLPNGLRVTAVRLATVARAELRLTMPLAPPCSGPAAVRSPLTGPVPSARAALLAASVLRGTTGVDGTRIETALGRIGGDVVPLAGADRLVLRGGVLAGGLGALLNTVAGALTSMTCSDHEMRAARTVLCGQAAVAGMRPAAAARALLHRHAPGWAGAPQEPPPAEIIAAITPEQVRELHARGLDPTRARLVLVGDLDPDGAVEAAREAFAGWTAAVTQPPALQLPEDPPPRPAEEVARTIALHPALRDGIAQVCLCAARDDEPLTPALRLASLVFGGHPGSRLVTRLRERHGFTYAVRVRPEELEERGPRPQPGGALPRARGHRLFITADTAPSKAHALVEALGDELARMAARPPSAGEVALACAHFAGVSLTTWSTQAGLADALADPSPQSPADPEALYGLMETVRRTPPEAVAAAGGAFSPDRFTGVLTGAAGTPRPSRHWAFGRAVGADDHDRPGAG
ncbi:M16 family metallopeptidase [Streptomyces sp. NPDC014734]|uniref:M16 family metallopeptidase n=1 Tax=Streptomyces sp. NPDC014734 TaxID=3364886 RepID=UPI0036F9943B